MNSPKISIESITQNIIILEEKYNLLEWTIDDVYIWQLIRVKVYLMVQEHTQKKKESSRFLCSSNYSELFQRIFINSIFYNPFFDFNKSNILVFESSRKYKLENDYIDIYTKYLCDEFELKNKKYKKYQTNYKSDKLSKNRKGTKHLDFIYLLAKLIIKFKKVELKQKDIILLNQLNKELQKIFKLNIDLISLCLSEIKKFKVDYSLYSILFKKKQPIEIYLVNYSNKAAIIKAAKDINIVVVEIQHGLIAKKDLIYHYPKTKNGSIAYFPDVFFIWEDIFTNDVSLPISESNIIQYGNRHLQEQKNKLVNISNKNTFLVISQPGLTNDIFEYIVNNIDFLSKSKIIIKLHPLEFDNYKNSIFYQSLKKVNGLEFVKNELSIYNLFTIAEYCIGVYSTAIIESLYFGKKIILLDLNGVEMMDNLLNNNKVLKVKVDDKLEEIIKKLNL